MPKNYGVIPVSKKLHKLIKQRALDEEKSMNKLMEDMFNKYIQNEVSLAKQMQNEVV